MIISDVRKQGEKAPTVERKVAKQTLENYLRPSDPGYRKKPGRPKGSRKRVENADNKQEAS